VGSVLFIRVWVMAEAMACGTPVIATPRGAVREVIEDGVTGFVVPVEGYAEAAAAALERLDGIDPKACRARVEGLFTVDRMLDGYEEAYRRVLSSSR
jgi:glycosyltransferase involved in cell wall biosynthesis